ncbi:hypothetical protein J1N10_14765 [Carboxylicivirga sp. A043]|uniref:hypothetical protein n=1 Tax=Carboxylicivirga litoralis TaxID=2816963 RepID=UPI0021CAE61E|nr:hypothetical protein [Carboxylicivirga sp. A043]MCU4157237.1 hypothetical protein [Carboxylicivirga sp. A043]
MLRFFILFILLAGGIVNTSAVAMQSSDERGYKSDIEYISECNTFSSDLEILNAEELKDDSNKLRLTHNFLFSEIDGQLGLKITCRRGKLGSASFILFESDNSPPFCL